MVLVIPINLWLWFWGWKSETKIAFLGLFIAGYIWWVANSIADNQSVIMSQQSNIMQEQTTLQAQFLNFEKDKNASEIAKKSEEEANRLFDLVMSWDKGTFQTVYAKVRDGKRVENMQSLDWFVSEFEHIGILYCNGEMQYNDLNGVMKGIIEPVCGNAQIYNYYQNTKSGLSGICQTLFPWSTVMAKYANAEKCVALR
jgi:hypothetical protein